MRLALTVVVATLFLGFTARGVDPQESPTGRGGWNREGAAKYLDEQMDTWLARAKQLQTGQGKAACVSCHTTLRHLWEIQRSDGAWDWLDFGLEPFESVDATYYGATLAALAVGTASSTTQATDATVGLGKLRGYLADNYAAQSLLNRIWLLLASTRLNDVLTPAQREALITEIQSRQRDDGGWSLHPLGTWRWSKPAWRARAPGTVDASLLAKADGFATGLIVYTLREAGVPVDQPVVRKGVQWLRAHQEDVQVSQGIRPAWRAYSLNFDREHGGEKGEPWRRMFMSDAATAFAVLALVASD